jgi:K+-sensing histidine kinase KdpD
VVGTVALVLVTAVDLRFRLNLVMVAFLYLIVVVITSLRGSPSASSLVAIIATVALHYVFIDPPFSMALGAPLDAAALVAFSTTALVITYLVSRPRKSLANSRLHETALDSSSTPSPPWCGAPFPTAAVTF